jgi:Beta-lactamase enzyme family
MASWVRASRRRLGALVIVLVPALLGWTPADAALPAGAFHGMAGGSRRLQDALLDALAAQHFDEVVDFGPVEDACPGASWCPADARRIGHVPNIDLAVITLDASGRPTAAADVLLSRDHPDGIGVPIDADLGTDAVRWRRWNTDRWNGGTFSDADGSQLTTMGWDDDPPFTAADDIVPGRDDADIQFMEPYPASTFKLLVAFHTLRLADAGVIDLDRPYPYTPEQTGVPLSRSTREWMDAMITESDNDSAKALLKQLHDLGQIDGLNDGLRRLGLGTLQVRGTDPATGGRWGVGQLTLTSLDAARLLLIVNGSPGVLWHTPEGRPVRSDVLSRSSRKLLFDLLAQQGWNDVLTTANWCGRGYPADGLPSRVADRWVDPQTGTVTVAGKAFGQDVRPCNARAEVDFAHKTGFTYNFLADAGIVHSLPGHPARHAVVVMLANLGYRYADPRFAGAAQAPCSDPAVGVCYTEKFARLGRALTAVIGAPPARRLRLLP